MPQMSTKSGAPDLDPANRPGVPMEREPQPLAGARMPISPQHSQVPVFKHRGRPDLPPVYGTAQPPKALSGVLRKVAYHYPDHWARHWMMLLLADRVDVWEHRIRRSLPWSVPLAALLVAGVTWRQLARGA